MSGIVHPSSVAPKSTLFRTLQSALALAETAGVARPLFRGLSNPAAASYGDFPVFWRVSIPKELCVAEIAVSTHRRGIVCGRTIGLIPITGDLRGVLNFGH